MMSFSLLFPKRFVSPRLRSLLAVSFWCFFSIFSSPSLQAAEQKGTITFAVGEWFPYTSKELFDLGVVSEIVLAASQAAGIDASIDFMPWPRAEREVIKGFFFGTFPYRITEERKKYYLFSAPLLLAPVQALRSKSNPDTKNFRYTSPEDFRGHRVGIIFGSDALKQPLQEHGALVEEVVSVNQNFIKLEKNRIDFFVDAREVLLENLKKYCAQENQKKFELLPGSFGEDAVLRIMVSKNYPDGKELLDAINRGLEKIRVSGEHRAILARHNITQEEDDTP